MDFKELFGFVLIVAGISIGVLLISLLLNTQYLSTAFLFCLGLFALASCFLGFFILNKSH